MCAGRSSSIPSGKDQEARVGAQEGEEGGFQNSDTPGNALKMEAQRLLRGEGKCASDQEMSFSGNEGHLGMSEGVWSLGQAWARDRGGHRCSPSLCRG